MESSATFKSNSYPVDYEMPFTMHWKLVAHSVWLLGCRMRSYHVRRIFCKVSEYVLHVLNQKSKFSFDTITFKDWITRILSLHEDVK